MRFYRLKLGRHGTRLRTLCNRGIAPRGVRVVSKRASYSSASVCCASSSATFGGIIRSINTNRHMLMTGSSTGSNRGLFARLRDLCPRGGKLFITLSAGRSGTIRRFASRPGDRDRGCSCLVCSPSVSSNMSVRGNRFGGRCNVFYKAITPSSTVRVVHHSHGTHRFILNLSAVRDGHRRSTVTV